MPGLYRATDTSRQGTLTREGSPTTQDLRSSQLDRAKNPSDDLIYDRCLLDRRPSGSTYLPRLFCGAND